MYDLDLCQSASLRVVNLVACLTALVRPREVRNRNEEERVAGVRNTGERVVPIEIASAHGSMSNLKRI